VFTLSPERDRGNGPETRPRIKPSKRGDVIPNLPALGARDPRPSGRGGGQSFMRAIIIKQAGEKNVQ